MSGPAPSKVPLPFVSSHSSPALTSPFATPPPVVNLTRSVSTVTVSERASLNWKSVAVTGVVVENWSPT